MRAAMARRSHGATTLGRRGDRLLKALPLDRDKLLAVDRMPLGMLVKATEQHQARAAKIKTMLRRGPD